ncbi:hypothetical protein [Hymenobacter negativus]|uniref:Uncharacterized protein n=1 Tax=Hymenobacter negativus TaxID=2795026 RepID=A0ABS0Q4K2_9BACT|nr:MULTISPECIES: hypothetical protein [Bacteria]MBH8557578.1 hypothetical protein [Hymenobacter negativus]MBH8567890.1 hypothetical protein [Hymenobacter negativus]MBR7207626.1 hypothetical protein [Microvirga sp. STS02]
MNNLVKKISVTLFVAGLTLSGLVAHAQTGNQEGGAKGKGAFVRKVDYTDCIPNSLLGVSGLNSCLTMSQSKFVLTPSGNAMSVWQGTVPATARPSQRVVYNSTWNETDQRGVPHSYNTEAVTMPDGTIKLTLTDNGKGNGKGKK